MIVVIEKNTNGKIEFTKEELEELLEKARAEGVREASKTTYITSPANPSPTIPNSPYFATPVTCSTPQAISSMEYDEAKINGIHTNNGI